MKKIYISADIEGIWGNANPAYTMAGSELYEEYRLNMINEVNLVIDLLFKYGAKEVVVNDGHGNMDNLLPSRIDKRVSFVSANGAYKEFGMMEGLDDSFDGVCLIGYHTRSNTPGIMAHTIWGSMIEHIEVDGKELGETGINAILAHEYGVPIVLISGDDKLHVQYEEDIGYKTNFVETKKAINSQTALCCSWDTLVSQYEKAIQKGMNQESIKKEKTSHTMRIRFHYIRNADFVSRMEEVKKVDNCTVEITKESFKELYRTMRFVIKICNVFA